MHATMREGGMSALLREERCAAAGIHEGRSKEGRHESNFRQRNWDERESRLKKTSRDEIYVP